MNNIKVIIMCAPEEINTANIVKRCFLENADELSYANLDFGCAYRGWVSDFGFHVENIGRYSLNLNNENDLFLLFVLSIVWSRSGQWENSAYFVAYLSAEGIGNPEYWRNLENVEDQQRIRKTSAINISSKINDHNPRKKISFRSDIFNSIYILATRWEEIKQAFDASVQDGDYRRFSIFIRNIDGLGANNKKILIKIPLILRELRCQGIVNNIPGELCCVPDDRVLKACKELGIHLPRPYQNAQNNLDALFAGSAKIYKLFGDLYDLPLFAYPDISGCIEGR
jgi:hypothetical protein